jgi:hypothetical protein
VDIPPRSGQSPESLPPTPFTIARIGKGPVCREDDGNDELICINSGYIDMQRYFKILGRFDSDLLTAEELSAA